MTVTNTSTVKSFSNFLAYMVEAPSHNGVDPRYVMTMTRGPMSLGSARSDFTRLMSGTNRSVQAVMTLHSAAPGELETIARRVEFEQDLPYNSVGAHDGPVVERYMQLVRQAEDASAPNTAGIYAAQIDGESGLLHVHGMRVNTMLADTEVPVRRRVNQRDDVGELVRDENGRPVPVLDDDGAVVYEETVEVVRAGQALPPSMRDTLRSRKKVDEVWARHGIDNEHIVTRNRDRVTWQGRARELLVSIENERTDAMTPEQVIEAIRARGHDATMRGKKRPVMSLDYVEGRTGAHHKVRLQRLSTDEHDFTTEAFLARVATAPEPIVEHSQRQEQVENEVVEVAHDEKVREAVEVASVATDEPIEPKRATTKVAEPEVVVEDVPEPEVVVKQPAVEVVVDREDESGVEDAPEVVTVEDEWSQAYAWHKDNIATHEKCWKLDDARRRQGYAETDAKRHKARRDGRRAGDRAQRVTDIMAAEGKSRMERLREVIDYWHEMTAEDAARAARAAQLKAEREARETVEQAVTVEDGIEFG